MINNNAAFIFFPLFKKTWEPTLNPILLQGTIHSPNKYLKADFFFHQYCGEHNLSLAPIHIIPYQTRWTQQAYRKVFVEVMTLKCGPDACGWHSLTSFRSQGWQGLRLYCHDTVSPWNGVDLWVFLMMLPDYPSEMLLNVFQSAEFMHPFASFSLVVFGVQTAHVVLREKENLSSCSRAAFLCFLFIIPTEDKTHTFTLDHCQIH